MFLIEAAANRRCNLFQVWDWVNTWTTCKYLREGSTVQSLGYGWNGQISIKPFLFILTWKVLSLGMHCSCFLSEASGSVYIFKNLSYFIFLFLLNPHIQQHTQDTVYIGQVVNMRWNMDAEISQRIRSEWKAFAPFVGILLLYRDAVSVI